MTREFVHSDIGEFGFSQFHLSENGRWRWIDLEVDCDPVTVENFDKNSSLTFQFWVNSDMSKFCIASNVLGHRRQASIPINMLNQLKITFTEPAKGGAEFQLAIDGEQYRGEIVNGEINVGMRKNSWDMHDYGIKKQHLEKIVESILKLTGGTVTKIIKYINA